MASIARYLILFIFLLLSCAAPTPHCKSLSNSQQKNYKLYISDTFTPLQQQLIQEAIDEWGKALNPIFVYKVSIIHLSNDELLEISFNDRLKFAIHNEVFIMPLPIADAPHKHTAAFYTDQYLFHYIAVIDKGHEINNPELYKAVIAHEMGHMFGLDHIDKRHKSIMYWRADESSMCITKIDLIELCKLWCCKAEELHPCLEPKPFVLGTSP